MSVPLDSGAPWELRGVARGLRVTDALARQGIPVPTTVAGDFKVEGVGPDPRAAFRVEAHAEGVGGRPPASLGVKGTASRRAVAIEELAGDIGGGSIEGSGALSAGETIEARVTMSDVRLAETPWLPAALSEIEGTFAGDARVEGSLQSPRGRVGLALSEPSFRGRGFPPLTIEALADGKEATLESQVGETTFLTGRLPFLDPWLLRVTMDLHALPMTDVLRRWPALEAMGATLTMDGQAVVDLPLREPRSARYDVRVDAVDLKLAGPWHAGPLRVHGDVQAAEVEGLDLRSGQSRLTVEGAIGFDSPARGLEFSLSGGDLASLLPRGSTEDGLRVPLAVSGRITADHFTLDAIVAEGQLTELGLVARAQEIGLESPVSWRLEHGRLTHSPLRLRGSSGTIDVEAGLDLRPDPAELRLRATGETDLAAFNPLLVEAGALGGRFRFDFAAERGSAGLEMTGQGQLEGGRLVLKAAATRRDEPRGHGARERTND